MDQNGDDVPTPDSPFSFQNLLYDDDWVFGDDCPTVDDDDNSSYSTVFPTIDDDDNSSYSTIVINIDDVNSQDSTVVVSNDDGANHLNSFVMDFGRGDTVDQWLAQLPSSQFEAISDWFDDGEFFTFEELRELFMEQTGDLDPEIIDELLDRRTFEKMDDHMEDCVICLGEIKQNEEASRLDCGHDYHFECIREWLMIKNVCPLCQQRVI